MDPSLAKLKREYSSRVKSASPAELVEISLELALAFIGGGDYARARQAICQLAESLDFRYDLSQHLYGVYMAIEKKLTAGAANSGMSAVSDAALLIKLLLNRWKGTALTDAPAGHCQSRPRVFVGLTYGAGGLGEYAEQDYSGGLKA